ncbi:MAG: VOC family protein [Candidatus Moraniibacteriota bacterium]
MKIHELGHVVLYVSDLARSQAFYRDLLGFPEIASDMPGAALFTTGRTHHELLLIGIGGIPRPKHVPEPGLYHIGLKIGNTDEELRQAKAELEKAGVTIIGLADHTVTHSLYILDPDGNELELYVDVSDEWKTDPGAVARPTRPLAL